MRRQNLLVASRGLSDKKAKLMGAGCEMKRGEGQNKKQIIWVIKAEWMSGWGVPKQTI